MSFPVKLFVDMEVDSCSLRLPHPQGAKLTGLLCFCFSKMMGAVIQRSELVLLFAFKCAGNKLRICCRAAASVVFINKKE